MLTKLLWALSGLEICLSPDKGKFFYNVYYFKVSAVPGRLVTASLLFPLFLVKLRRDVAAERIVGPPVPSSSNQDALIQIVAADVAALVHHN